MTEYVKVTDCAAKSCWKGSTLVVVFLAIALALGAVGGFAIANGATISAQTDAQRREFDAVNERLGTIETLVRELKGPQ